MTSEINNQYNEDELHAPEWLNKNFFEVVLNQHESCNSVQVEKYEIFPGTSKDDHYASVMFRAKIYYNLSSNSNFKSISLIIKTTPEEESLKMDLMREFTVFQTEIMMYSKLLPKMEQQLRTAGDDTQLCAKMIYSSLTPHQCIIFEDLVEKGYSVISKRTCTLEEVTKVLDILARIHAASYKLVQEGDTEIPKLNSSFTRKNLDKFGFLHEGIKYCKEIANNEEDLKKYVPYIENVETHILDDIVAYFDPKEICKRGGILLLNHGDFHCKNMMVNYENNSLKNVMLIDYQLCYYGSPVLDLMNALVMMFSPQMRLSNRDKIFSNYIETFQKTLTKLKFEGIIPTNADFEDEWKKYKCWELFLVMSGLIFNYSIADGTVAISDLVENSEVRKQIWEDKRVLNEIRQQLPRLVKQGYFD